MLASVHRPAFQHDAVSSPAEFLPSGAMPHPVVVPPTAVSTILHQASECAVSSAKRHHLRSQDQVPDGVRFANGIRKRFWVADTRRKHRHTRRSKQPLECFAGFTSLVRQVEELGMGDIPDQLSQARHRDRPLGGRSPKCHQAGSSSLVLRQFRQISTDQYIRSCGNQSRCSIFS